MTAIHLRTYSNEMISEFELLSHKLTQLAELTQSLRRENGELRLSSAALSTENAQLNQRMQEAHGRVAALLEKLVEDDDDEVEDAA